MARSMLPGRLLDPGSNVGARGMITLSGLPERQNPAYRPASALFSHRVAPSGATGQSPLFYQTHPPQYQAPLK